MKIPSHFRPCVERIMMFTIFGTKDSGRLAISTKKQHEKDSEIMAVNLAALRAVLVRKGTTTEVVNEVTATPGIDTIEELRILTDDEVETLCRAIHHPGVMPNPAFNATGGVAAALAAGIPAQVTNTGHMILARAENNIKLAAYFLRFKEHTSWAPDAAIITLGNVHSLLDHKKWEETHDDVDAPTLNEKDWPHTIKAIEEWF